MDSKHEYNQIERSNKNNGTLCKTYTGESFFQRSNTMEW